MRVITEEILKNKYEEIKQAYLNCDQSHIYAESRVIATIEELMYELRDIDQLTKKDSKTTLEKFREMESKCQELIDETPLERLRFFISLMCDTNQDSQAWFDIEFLFDECTNNEQRTDQP